MYEVSNQYKYFVGIYVLFSRHFLMCSLFQRNDQHVSITTKMLMIVYCIIILVTGAFSYDGKINWLDFIYYCSYIKLSITLIKYIPQVIILIFPLNWITVLSFHILTDYLSISYVGCDEL